MIISNINGNDYRLNFKYDTEDYATRGTVKVTKCNVEVVESGGRFDDNGKKIGESVAICDPRDNFDKSVGRKIALQRALVEIDKSTRAKIWSAYFTKISH